MKKVLGSVAVAILMLFPLVANAKEINSAGTPGMVEGKNVFEAKGTPVVINEVGGKTIITWEGETNGVEVNSTTIIVGGYYNPCSNVSDSDICTIDLDSTSITMNSGTIGYIIGGNAIDGYKTGTKTPVYSNYSKIHVGTINIDINGGTIAEVSAVSMAKSGYSNTSLSADYYSKIKEYYYADKVNIDVNDAIITTRMYVLSSYTYAKDVVVNLDNSQVMKDYYSLAVGTNGLVSNYTVNINDSKVDILHSGFRAMVENWVVNVTGKSVIGDIYAGSYYPLEEQSTESWWSTNIGNVDYGQVGKMTFTLGEDVEYNNIYAGFQFVDKAKFLETYKGNSALETYAKGIENSEKALVVINVAKAPKVTDSKMISMLDSKMDNVTINYSTKTEDLPTIDTTKPVEKPQVGVSNTSKLDQILQETLKNNTIAIKSIASGINVLTAVKIASVEASTEVQTKVENILKEKEVNGTIASYFDISVLLKKQADGSVITTIPELSDKIELMVVLPENIQKAQDGYTRKFYIVREHDDVVEMLDAKLSDDGKYVTFSSDKFSTYALAYSDTITPSTPDVNNPQTGDNVVLYISLGLLSLGGIAYLIKIRKSKN